MAVSVGVFFYEFKKFVSFQSQHLRNRARYCNVSKIIVSTQKSWLLLMPNVSRVFSVSWLLL